MSDLILWLILSNLKGLIGGGNLKIPSLLLQPVLYKLTLTRFLANTTHRLYALFARYKCASFIPGIVLLILLSFASLHLVVDSYYLSNNCTNRTIQLSVLDFILLYMKQELFRVLQQSAVVGSLNTVLILNTQHWLPWTIRTPTHLQRLLEKVLVYSLFQKNNQIIFYRLLWKN